MRTRWLRLILKKYQGLGLCTSMIALLFFSFATECLAKGNLTKRAERLNTMKIDALKGFSHKEFQLETGKFYRWRIIADGRDEYKIMFPELSRNAWFDQISIDNKEVKPFGGIYAVEFDKEGTIDVFFIPIRPGTYNFYVDNYIKSGMLGKFVVK